MKLYTHLKLSHAHEIIMLASKGISRYKISQITGISKGKMRRCLDKAKRVRKIENKSKPWKGSHIKVTYHFKLYQDIRDLEKWKGLLLLQVKQSLYTNHSWIFVLLHMEKESLVRKLKDQLKNT